MVIIMHYYDPMFYICSSAMPFGIRIEATLKYKTEKSALQYAVNTAIKRYPYFSVKIVKEGNDLITVPNDLPIKVFEGDLPYPLASKEVNGHILALSFCGNKINFHTTHVITDGAGFTPFVKSVLYYYLCKLLNTELPHTGIRLAGDELFEDEAGNPYPEEEMKCAKEFFKVPEKEYFRIENGGFVNDNIRTSYNFSVNQADVLKFSHENDASPCALFSALMSEAIRDVHPNEKKDIVSAISFNLRPGLKNKNSYRMLCSAIFVRYPYRLHNLDISKICTCTRGAVTLQSQPENVIYYAKQTKERLENLLKLPDIQSKRDALSKAALQDSVNNTFSVSYVGQVDYGSVTEHLEGMHYYTDGSTYKTLFIEIASFGDRFYISLLQGFSSDRYYKSLLNRLSINKIAYKKEGEVPLNTPEIELPY